MNHIAAIHAIKSKISMTEEDYRALLLELTGKSSSKGLSPLALARVRDHFDKLAKAHGVPHVAGRKGSASNDAFAKAKAAASPTERKCWALWYALHKAGKTKSNSPAAFGAFVKRQTKTATHPGMDSIRFCSFEQTMNLIESMKHWLERDSQPLTGESKPL